MRGWLRSLRELWACAAGGTGVMRDLSHTPTIPRAATVGLPGVSARRLRLPRPTLPVLVTYQSTEVDPLTGCLGRQRGVALLLH